jgi:hypothetical protein
MMAARSSSRCGSDFEKRISKGKQQRLAAYASLKIASHVACALRFRLLIQSWVRSRVADIAGST